MIYNVPVFCQRPVGRDTDVLGLWQNLLSGKKTQTITGIEGVGKSTLASQFCECARKSGRFSCIQWFNAEHAVEDQLHEFVRGMKDRSEKEILLVFDDVQSVSTVSKLIPRHESICSLIIAQQPTKGSSGNGESAPNEFAVGPLAESAALEIAPGASSPLSCSDPETTSALVRDLGHVPLLMAIADGLVLTGGFSPQDISSALRTAGAVSSDAISVSDACTVLVKLALDKLSIDAPLAHKILATSAALHISDLSPAILDAAAGTDASEFARKAEAIALLSHKWETESYALHRQVAQALLTLLDKTSQASILAEASQMLLSLWPRKTRSAGSALTESLVWHSLALRNTFMSLGVDFTEELITALDRSATYLAQSEGRHLSSAADLWESVVKFHLSKKIVSGAQVEAAWNCGRLQHFLRRPQAAATLKHAFETASAVQGKSSVEASLILACYAPYLDASSSAVSLLLDGAKTLQERSSTPGAAKADVKMMKESAAVILLRCIQMYGEQGLEAPPHVQSSVDQMRADLLLLK